MRHGVLACLMIVLAISCGAAAAADIARIDEDLYVGGQPTAADIAAFAREGGRHVINLRPPSETPGLDEAAVATAAGLAYHNLPIAGPGDLTRANVQTLDRLLSRLEGEKTLLHCSSSNRVGALMALRAAWLHGASDEEALAIGREHGLAGLQGQVEKLLRKD